MKSALASRNVTIDGHRTSLRLEDDVWDALVEICRRQDCTVHDICTEVERERMGSNRTSAVRTFVLNYFRSASTGSGHAGAGHGRLDSDHIVFARTGRRRRTVVENPGPGPAVSPRKRPIAAISHSLRTPLNTIMGLSELIKNETFGPIENPKYRSYIEDIHGSGRSILDAVEDLHGLAYSME